jgi:anaerobic magnesium-protoporphyrin IX monomethyl ester cyclase
VNDRKLRTIGLLSLVTGTTIVLVILALYAFEVPGAIMIPILMVYTMLQFRFSSVLFNTINKSKLADLPVFLQKKYPPPHFQSLDRPCDIVLLRPPSAVLSGPDCGEALGLGYLASVLRKNGYEVVCIDQRLEKLEVMQAVELIVAYNPKALGVNLNFQYLSPVTKEILQALHDRKFDGHITLGGLYASVAASDLMDEMPSVHTVVQFEGEETYLDLVRNIDREENWKNIAGLVLRDVGGEIRTNPLRPLISNLTDIPVPARDHLDLALRMGGYAYVISSRGCRGRCAYCVQSRSVADPEGARWRGRDAIDVADEMAQIVESSGARLFSFVDDDIFGPTRDGENNAHRLARAIIDRGLDVSILTSVQPKDVEPEVFKLLKSAGMESVILAVDNFSQSVLSRYQKYSNVADNLRSIEVLKDLGIDAYLGIIMFDPHTTLGELVENFQAMMDIHPFLRPWQILSKLEVYHGSKLTVTLEEQGLLDKKGYYSTYEFVDPRIASVYTAIENFIKEAYPAMTELDLLRWGNLGYSEPDQLVLDYCNDELIEISQEYNRGILSIALDIVNKQKESETVIPALELADDDLLDRVRYNSRETKQQLSDLRTKAKEISQNNESEHKVEQEGIR